MKRETIICLLISLLFLSPLARAGTKEEIMRLQSDVNDLRSQLREFEKTFSEKTDGLRSLVIQLNDQVAKSNLILDRVSKTLETRASGEQSTNQTLLQEIRNLSAKIDDAGTRISAMAQQVADLKIQSKPLPQGASGGGSSDDSMYNQALNDYIQGNFDLAVQGFTAYLSNYPGGTRAVDAQFYLGDSYSAQNKLREAIIAFTRVINDYPGADKVPTALFKRATAELAMQETDNAIADYRDVIERFPESTEADRAQAELRKLGVSAKKPAPAKPTRRR